MIMKNTSSEILIKNMVCNRCILAVEQLFSALQIPVQEVKLGEVLLEKEVNLKEISQLKQELSKVGFELIETRSEKLIKDIKRITIEYLNSDYIQNKIPLSLFLTQYLSYDYSYLSDLFSKKEQKTIEQFFILQRIEKVKALILLNHFTFSEIAFQVGFSSVHHMSSQFKKVTQMTPSAFKTLERKPMRAIDEI